LPSKPRVDPSVYIPTAEDLIAVVRRRPGASLRELCAVLFPDTAWSACGGCDSMQRVREWQAPIGAGRPGNRLVRMSAAEMIRDMLADLVAVGRLRYAQRRRDEIDALASIAFAPAAVAEDSPPLDRHSAPLLAH